MGLLKSAFNAVSRIHSRSVTIKRLGSPDLFSPARATPSNYFRYLAGPSDTVVSGSEIIIPAATMFGTQVQLVSFSAVPTSGTWKLTYNGNSTSDLNFGDNAATVQSSLRLVSGVANVAVSGDYTTGFSVAMYGVQTPVLLVASNGGTPLDATMSVKFGAGIPMDPLIKRGDKVIDGTTPKTVKEIIPIPDLGGDDMGFRVRIE